MYKSEVNFNLYFKFRHLVDLLKGKKCIHFYDTERIKLTLCKTNGKCNPYRKTLCTLTCMFSFIKYGIETRESVANIQSRPSRFGHTINGWVRLSKLPSPSWDPLGIPDLFIGQQETFKSYLLSKVEHRGHIQQISTIIIYISWIC